MRGRGAPLTVENETGFKKLIVLYLRRAGWLVYVTSERRRGYTKMPSGLPDLFIRNVGKRRHGWIEVKQPGGKLRADQELFRAEALAAGEEHYTVDCMADLDGILAPPLSTP